jgi:hypothetical protein
MRLFICFAALIASCAAAYFHNIKIVKVVNCTSSNQNSLSFDTCIASRATGLNVTFNVKKKVKIFSVSFELCSCNFFSFKLFHSQYDLRVFEKRNQEFIQIEKSNATNVNWCDYLKGRHGGRLYIYVAKLVLPQLFRKCPILGRFEFVNVNVGKIFFTPLKQGVYRYDLKLTDDESKDFIFMSGLVEIEEI